MSAYEFFDVLRYHLPHTPMYTVIIFLAVLTGWIAVGIFILQLFGVWNEYE